MTEAEHLAWDAHQQAIAGEITHLADLMAKLPDGHNYTATRNRLVMAMDSLETARDQIAAARQRYDETQQ
jgi:hypothetical protein